MITKWIDPDTDVDLGGYFLSIQKLHGVIRLVDLVADEDASYFKIDKLFVEPALSSTYVPPEQDVYEWPESTSLLKALQDHSHLVVLGDPGSGKSTMVSWLSTRFGTTVPNLFRTRLGDLVPIPIILREMDLTKVNSWDELIEQWRNRPEYCYDEDQIGVNPGPILSKEKVELIFASGQAIVMLDGIDEVSTPELRLLVRGFVHDAQRRYPHVHWVFTSRIVGYQEAPFYSRRIVANYIAGSIGGADIEDDWPLEHMGSFARVKGVGSSAMKQEVLMMVPLEGSLHYVLERPSEDEIKADTDYGRFYLLPFDDKRVEEFAAQWYEAREPVRVKAQENAKGFVDAIKEHPNIAEIMRNPILLTFLALIHQRDVRLPDGRGQVYYRIAEIFLERIPLRKQLLDVRYRLDEKMRWLGRVALRMQAMRLGDDQGALLLSESELRQMFLEAMLLDDSAVDEEKADEFLKFIARRAGLLLPRSEDEYAFVHLSFQEFFAAWAIKESITRRKFQASKAEASEEAREKIWTTAETRSLSLEEMADVLPMWANTETWSETLQMVTEIVEEDSADVFMEACLVLAESHRAPASASLLSEGVERYEDGNVLWLCGQVARDPMARLSQDVRSRCLCLVNDRLLDDSVHFLKRSSILAGAFGTVSLVNEHLQLLGLSEPLTRLSFLGSQVSNLSPLSGLGSLRTLDVSGTQVSDLSPLSGLGSLQTLYVSGTQVSDLSPLSGLGSLRTLYVYGPQVSDLSPLSGLSSLQTLYVYGRQVSDLSPLSGLGSLQTLYVYGTQVSDLSPLSGLGSLRQLYVSGSKVSELSPLSGLGSLQALYVYGSQVSDLSPLSGLGSLRTLDVSRTQVSDLSPLTGLGSLHTLDLDGTQISDLSPLSGLGSLQTLDLDGTQVSDLSPLIGLDSLKKLSIVNLQVDGRVLEALRSNGVEIIGPITQQELGANDPG